MILSIQPSKVAHKRYAVLFQFPDGKQKIYNFGLKTGFTYVDGATDTARENYLKRHLANKTEHLLITRLTPSPALFSARILWGKSRSIQANIDALNREMGKS